MKLTDNMKLPLAIVHKSPKDARSVIRVTFTNGAFYKSIKECMN